MSNVIVMNDNLLVTAELAASSYSSQQSAYPVTNVYNGNRRSKVWRTNGYWNIESGSNTIVFRESVGVDLTATITAGEYTSTSSFITAVKAALDAAGDSTYTVSQNSTTKKMTIASNGSGGGGIFQLMWTDSDSTAMAGILGFDTSADDTGALTYTADVLKIHTNEFLKWDLGLAANPKAFVLIGPKDEAIKFSPSSTVTLQGNETDVWTAPSYSQALTFNEKVMVLQDSDGLHTEGLRYWRLNIVDASNPLTYIEAGYVYLGDCFVPARGAIQFPFSTEHIDRSASVITEAGYSFSEVKTKTVRHSVDWSALTYADKEELQDLFDDYGTHSAFFISLDPNAVFGSSSNENLKFVKFDSAPTFTLTAPNHFTARMVLREEI